MADDEPSVRSLLGWVDLVADGAAEGDGVTNDSPALQRAVDRAAAYQPGGTVFVASRSGGSTYLLGTSVTIPSNVTLKISGGARFYVATGVTLTINGPLESPRPKAELFILFGSGAVAYGASVVTLETVNTFLQAGTGAVARTTRQKLQERVSVADFGAIGDGVTDNALAIQRAINELAAVGGGLLYADSVHYALASTVDLSGANNVHIIAKGASFDFSGTGYCFDVSAVAVPSGVGIEGCTINTTAAALGGLRVGRVAQAFNNGYYRQRWILRDVSINGPGSNVAGRLGMSLTQLATSILERVEVLSFESCILHDRNTANQYDRVRVGNFVFGREWRLGDAPGASADVDVSGEYNGPDWGTGGWPLKIDQGTVRLLAPYFEYVAPIGVTCKAIVWVTTHGSGLRITDSQWDITQTPGVLTNTILLDAGSGRTVWTAAQWGGATPAAVISIGAPGGSSQSNLHQFVECDSAFLTALAAPLTSGYSRWNGNLIASAVLNFDLSAVAYQDLTISLPGAAVGQPVAVGVGLSAMVAGIGYVGAVVNADLVTVRAFAIGGATPNPPSATFTVTLPQV